MLALHVGAAGSVVTEGLDEDVLGRVVEAARPVEPQAPSSARVASVKALAISGQSSACSGFTANFAVMKIKGITPVARGWRCRRLGVLPGTPTIVPDQACASPPRGHPEGVMT